MKHFSEISFCHPDISNKLKFPSNISMDIKVCFGIHK